jgi:hypothetical protein
MTLNFGPQDLLKIPEPDLREHVLGQQLHKLLSCP